MRFSKLTLVMVTVFLWFLVSLRNQVAYNITPLTRDFDSTIKSLQLTNNDRYELSLGSAWEAIEKIKNLPESTTLYFAPSFEPPTKGSANWWHLNHVMRYFVYPRRILSFHFDLYHNNREEYSARFIRGAKKYSEVDWIRSRNIEYVIFYDKGVIKISTISKATGF